MHSKPSKTIFFEGKGARQLVLDLAVHCHNIMAIDLLCTQRVRLNDACIKQRDSMIVIGLYSDFLDTRHRMTESIP